MTCAYCQLANHEEDHRCARCGRRLVGTATAAPPAQAREHVRMAVRTLGANALAAAPLASPAQAAPRSMPRTAATRRAPEISMDAAATLDGLPRPRATARATAPAQPSLFGAELQPKLIPFESLPRVYSPESPASESKASAAPVRPISLAPESKPAAPKTSSKATTRRTAPAEDPQATLDFLPALKTTGRTLKTNAEAVIFCDATVAGPVHRATAAALDLGMIAIAFSAVVTIFEQFAKPASLDRMTLVMLAGMLGITALFYGLLFAIAGTVSPGMKWTHLRLITFDGFSVDGRSRALRCMGGWISVLSGGIGLLWALLDEENLTWHDHISKTFPTLRESESTVVRQAKR